MVDRYFSIRDAIGHVPSAEDLVSRGPARRRIVALHEKLKELNSVCFNRSARWLRCALYSMRVWTSIQR